MAESKGKLAALATLLIVAPAVSFMVARNAGNPGDSPLPSPSGTQTPSVKPSVTKSPTGKPTSRAAALAEMVRAGVNNGSSWGDMQAAAGPAGSDASQPSAFTMPTLPHQIEATRSFRLA